MPGFFSRCTPFLVWLLLAGCSHYSYDLGETLPRESVSRLAVGQQLGTVLRELGPPLRISALPDGFVVAWEHWDIQETNVGFSLGFAGAEAFSMDWGTSATQGEFLLVAFDSDRKLVGHAFTQWSDDAGGGQAIQPFGGFLSVADVDDLTERMPQHRWGAASLNRLPATLNVQNGPDSGSAGLEQRGTPRGSGQRTLEMD